MDCIDCKYIDELGQETCFNCIEQNRFEAANNVIMPAVKKPEPLLTKNEYLALELTKVYVGQNMTALMATTIADKYEYFLDRFNKETET